MRDEKLRLRFGKAGRLRAEAKFSWRAIAKETKTLYESLVRTGIRQAQTTYPIAAGPSKLR
jgi:glycosyltransferase involved in cell wall biosynthesis